MFRLRYTGPYHEHNRYKELELMQNVHSGSFLWKPGVLPRVITELNWCNASHRQGQARTKCKGKHKVMSKRFLFVWMWMLWMTQSNQSPEPRIITRPLLYVPTADGGQWQKVLVGTLLLPTIAR